MLLSSLLLALYPVLVVSAAGTKQSCLPSGTEAAINTALNLGGRGATVALCQGSTHRLNSSIFFTSTGQTLTTEGNPKGIERAMLIVEGPDQAVAIKGDFKHCSHSTIRSLIIDGNRPQLLRIPKGGALVELGNSEFQTVRDCKLYEPRGWSALHFREGDLKQCRKAHAVDNEIGPCGEEWDDDYDGVTEAEPVNGNPRADGISLACQDSLVERNTITDTTDGAIVLFGSAGTEVRENHIYSRTRVVLGGINLVDYPPWKGDYFGVKVHHNTIHAMATYLKAGIVVGPSSWSDDTESIVHSGHVTDNFFTGPKFGYALVVSSADSFTVLRNKIDEGNIGFSGVPGSRCPTAPENSSPRAFLLNKGSAKGTFQTDFENGEVQHIICINPPDENRIPYKPWRLRDDPNAKKVKTEETAEAELESAGAVTFDSRLAEAVVAYQMSMLKALSTVNDQLESRNQRSSEKQEAAVEQAEQAKRKNHKQKTGIREIDELSQKLDLIESSEKGLVRELDMMNKEMRDMSKRIKKSAAESKPILADVFNNVGGLKSATASHKRVLQSERETLETSTSTSLFGSVTMLVGIAAVMGIALQLVKRFRSRGLKKGKVY